MRRIPQLGTPNFSSSKILPEIFNRLKFEFSAFSGLKVDGIGRKKKQQKKDKLYSSGGKRT